MSSLTIDQLYYVVQEIGIAQAVASGALHNLPYVPAGSTNVRMVSVAVASGTGTATYGFSPALTQQPLVTTTVLNPVANYHYAVTVTPIDFASATLTVTATWVGGGSDPLTGFPVNVGVRAQQFIAS